MMCSKEVCSHSSKTFVVGIFFFNWRKFSQSVKQRRRTKEFYSPFVASYLLKKIVFSSEEGLTEIDSGYWELPFIGVFVFDDEEHSIFSCVMETLGVLALWIN